MLSKCMVFTNFYSEPCGRCRCVLVSPLWTSRSDRLCIETKSTVQILTMILVVLKVHRRLVRKTTTTTTTEDPRLLGLTLDPRLEVDTLGLDAVMIPKDHLGASILGTIELHRMSRMADIPLAMTRIGPAPPVPPAPVEPAPIRSPPVAPAGPNYLSLYYLSCKYLSRSDRMN